MTQQTLNNLTLAKSAQDGYADMTIYRDGEAVGMVNTQYCYVNLDGRDHQGIKPTHRLYPLVLRAREMSHAAPNASVVAPLTSEETAINEYRADDLTLAQQDARNSKHPGYCTKCHTYCYGDCN
jgi:hypothetical protein